jgi:NADPH2:quinone reductase
MRAVRYHEPGDSDVLRVEEIPRPAPGPDEILVDVHAAGINPVDAKYRASGHEQMPKTTGSDFAGVVEEIGDKVQEYEPGDRVFGTGFYSARFQQGSFADYVTVPMDIVAPLPSSVSFETGSAMGIVGTTAWLGLIEWSCLGPTDTCLIHGGTGGVGHIGVQLAARSGASVLATVGSQDRIEVAKQFGADHVFNYNDTDIADAIHGVAYDGVDVVLEPRYGENAQLDVDVCGFDADVIVIDGDGESFDGAQARGKHLAVRMLSMTPLVERKNYPTLSSVLRELATMMRDGELAVTIDRTYDISEAPAAHRDVLNERFVGKAVVKIR